MKVVIFPVLGHLKGAGRRLKEVIEREDPDLILVRIDSEEELEGSPILDILKSLELYSEIYEEKEEIPEGATWISIDEGELAESLPEKFSVFDVIKYNLFLRKLKREKWESLEEFLIWWEKSSLSIKHIRIVCEKIAERILEEIERREASKVLVIADYLTSKVLLEKASLLRASLQFEDYLLSRLDCN